MPVVEMPNGDRVQFPDDMPKEQIRALIVKKFPEVASGAAPAAPSPEYQSAMEEMSRRTQNPAYGQYAAMDGWEKPIVAASDIADIGLDSLTFGLGNRAAAGLRAPFTDKTYSEELEAMRAKTTAARQRAGSAGVAADVLGAVAVPMAASSRGLTLVGRAGTAGMTGAKGVAGRAALAGVEGAGYGAAQAAGHGENVGTGALLGLAGGAGGSMIADAAGATVRAASRQINKFTGKAKPIPEFKELRDAATQAYKRSEEAGVVVRPEAMQRLNATIQNDLAEFGFDPALQGRIMPVLSRLETAGQGNITLKGIDSIRRVANKARISQAADERELGGKIIARIDDFVEEITPQDVVMGDAITGTSALNKARSLWRRVAKNEELATAVRRADLRAASTGSGGNTENAIRQNLRKIVERGKGWTPDEMTALEEIVRGTPTQNVLRLVGKLSPAGNGLMAALGVGGAMVNPTFGAASLAGLGSKAMADRGVMRAVQSLDQLIRAGGTKEALNAFQGSLKTLSQAQREAVVRIAFGGPTALARQPSE